MEVSAEPSAYVEVVSGEAQTEPEVPATRNQSRFKTCSEFAIRTANVTHEEPAMHSLRQSEHTMRRSVDQQSEYKPAMTISEKPRIRHQTARGLRLKTAAPRKVEVPISIKDGESNHARFIVSVCKVKQARKSDAASLAQRTQRTTQTESFYD